MLSYVINEILNFIGVFNFVLGFVREDDFGILDFHQQHVPIPVVEWSHPNQHLISISIICYLICYIKTPSAHQSTFLS